MSAPGTLAPLGERNFRWYFGARTVNLVGSTMNGVALAFGPGLAAEGFGFRSAQ